MFAVQAWNVGWFRRPVLCGVGGALAVAVMSGAARAGVSVPSYTLQDLGTLPGATTSSAAGINDAGQVVGTSGTSQSTQAFLYTGGTLQNLGASLSGSSYATGINDAGQVVGYTANGNLANGAFLYSGGSVQPLTQLIDAAGINNNGQIAGDVNVPNPGAHYPAIYSNGSVQTLSQQSRFNTAAGINNTGQVVFNFEEGTTYEGELYSNGTLSQLPTLGGVSGTVYGINDQGQIVGTAMISGTYRGGNEEAYVYSGGTIQDLGTLGGGTSEALAINNTGEIVGNSETATSGTATDGFLDVNGTMYDLNALVSGDAGYVITSAVAINASGEIAADAITPSGQEDAVLLTPSTTAVPLPPALWASLTALPLLLLGKRLRRVVA